MTPSTTSPDGPSLPHSRPFRLLVPLAFWLLVWQAAAMWVGRAALSAAWAAGDGAAFREALFRGKELLLPAPLLVADTLLSLVADPAFWQAAGLSLLRILAGFLLGVALGALLAVAAAVFPWADLLLSPLVGVIRATPVASFILLVLLWVFTGRVPAVCAALMVLPVLWGNVRKGVAQTDPLLLEAAQAYRFSRWKVFRLVYVPSVLPYFASGCGTALGLAWKAGVAAEVLCVPKLAIGTQIYYSKLYVETPALFAWTAVVILLSFLLERLFGAFFQRMERGRGR